MNMCRCGHPRVLHHGPNGPCLSLTLTQTAWTAGCGCPEYRPDSQQKPPK